MSYQVLARKWRPKSFQTLVGQDHVVRALSNALDQQRLHHAYLFTGTRGVGKTTLSRILAKSFNCETGITSKPCNVCSACVAIDKGAFIDYVEMDAASNRGIDDMTSLLEKAIYAPTVGRFKVYMLDEVHQLTGPAFNAMLKTLEEPPSHVKFILATTDPQKMPVTVLSRCLQFNLRQMSPVDISNHLSFVLGEEKIPFDNVALQLISRAASGSMRDALSLLDQAIAYGGNSVNELEVRNMLGAIDQSYLYQLLTCITANNGAEMLAVAKTMEQRSLSFDAALNDLANLLHQIAIAQTVPDSIAEDFPERAALLDLAANIPTENVQLYYQIALLARRDLGLAPDEYAGFTMALLRMLAFTPNEAPALKATQQAPQPPANKPASMPSIGAREALAALKPSTTQNTNVELVKNNAPTIQNLAPADENQAAERQTVGNLTAENQYAESQYNISKNSALANHPIETPPENTVHPTFDGDWRALVEMLKLGIAKSLAVHSELIKYDENNLYFTLAESDKHLINNQYQEKLKLAISQHFGHKVTLHFSLSTSVDDIKNTPIAQISQEKATVQNNAEQAIYEDSFVQALIKDFGATIIPNSIKPI